MTTLLAACAVALAAHPASVHPVAYTTVVGRGPSAAIVDAASGRIFVANDLDATVSMLDMANGHVLRTVSTGDASLVAAQAMAIDERLQRVFVVNEGDDGAGSRLSVLDAHDGTLIQTIRVGHDAGAVAVDARAGHVFVADEGDRTVRMIDAASGVALRDVGVDYTPMAVTVDERTARAFVVSWAILPGDHGGAGVLSILDTRSGAVVRTISVGSAPGTAVVDASAGRVFVANDGDGTVSMIDARSGALIGATTLGLGHMAMAVDERRGLVFVVDKQDGSLRLLNARTGELVRASQLAPSFTPAILPSRAIAVDQRGDRVLVTTWGPTDSVGLPRGVGRVQVLAARTLIVLTSIPVGLAPVAVTVDERNGRAIVVNEGGVADPDGGWKERLLQGARRWLRWLPTQTSALPPSLGSVSVLDTHAGV